MRRILVEDVVDMDDIANMFEVQANTVRVWVHTRKIMPPPLRWFGDSPVWDRYEIIHWGKKTNREIFNSQAGSDNFTSDPDEFTSVFTSDDASVA